MKRKNYRKMLEDIDNLVNNDWGFEMVDMKINLHKTKANRDGSYTFTPNKIVYHNFTQKEAEEMSATLGQIYRISHGITCSCGNKYRV